MIFENVIKTCSQCGVTKPGADFRSSMEYVDEPCWDCRDGNKESRRNNRVRRAKVLVTGAKHRAKKLGLPFDLDAHIPDLQRRVSAGVCEMSGTPLTFSGRRTFDSPSIDRIESSKGYVHDNVRIVCWAMNSALGTWGEADLEAVMRGWLARKSGTAVAR